MGLQLLRLECGFQDIEIYYMRCCFGTEEQISPSPGFCLTEASFWVLVIVELVFSCIVYCEAMAEEPRYQRYLLERKKTVKADVAKARKEYQGIVNYLQQLMHQVLLGHNNNYNNNKHIYIAP